ncbi:hypothetical protein NDU88_004790 [Pleurodeles waltl]|uniref:Reverse transcriptase domain-containing protein n=1 Tax=Pleurodeles waltl TaxID=8319 RepID=A0AAV7TTG4_PLEWA|nr:hypothetical protein NDU88_004790 [Pleurodeles waltl]
MLAAKVKSGSHFDPASAAFLEGGMEAIFPVLCDLLNLSFSMCEVPSSWKNATVAPLLKKPSLDPSKPENFRLLSLLPFFDRIAEKHVNQQLMRYIDQKEILRETQSGFRSNFCTESALLLALASLRLIADDGKTAALIVLNLNAAFDTMSHGLLLDRLQQHSIGDCTIDRLADFLQNRYSSHVLLGYFLYGRECQRVAP